MFFHCRNKVFANSHYHILRGFKLYYYAKDEEFCDSGQGARLTAALSLRDIQKGNEENCQH